MCLMPAAIRSDVPALSPVCPPRTGRKSSAELARGPDAGELSIPGALTNRIGRYTTTLPVCYSCIRLRWPQHPTSMAPGRCWGSSFFVERLKPKTSELLLFK